MTLSRRHFTAAALSLISLGPLGCSSLPESGEKKSGSFLDRMPWASKDKGGEQPEPYPNPVKIAATWTPDSLVQTGRTPTRGFGGRVFFYDERSRPVPVEGTLIVHGFDDAAADPKKTVKRFEFTPEQFTRHFSQTDLGASYSVWIPWDAVGGAQKRISLVPSFRTADGKLVQGTPATLMLPGKSMATPKEEELATFSPQYLRFREASRQEMTRSSGLTTTTIRRRNTRASGESNLRGMPIPANSSPVAEIAENSSTPAVDLQMTPRRRPSRIMPASAQMPLQR